MTSKLADIKKSNGFYGWIALSGAVISLFIACFPGQCFGVFLPVLSNEFGWSRAAVAAALSLNNLATGLPSPLWGIMAGRFGPRINIILGGTLTSMGLAGLYFLSSLWYLYLLLIFVGLGVGLGGNIQSSTIANNWFSKRISLAQGIIASAAGITGFIFPPLTTALIESVGWRLTWVIIGGITLVGGAIIGGIVLVRNRPEDLGQVPDGIRTQLNKGIARTVALYRQDSNQAEWRMKDLLRMPVTWLIISFMIASGIVLGVTVTHQVAYMQDIGFSPLTAASTMSAWAASLIIGSLAFGALALKINIRYLGTSAFALLLVAFVILLTSRELAVLYLYSALVGMGYGALLAAIPTFVGTYFGRQLYPRLIGIAMALHIAAGAVAGTIAGVIFDSSGSYKLAFFIVVGFILIGLVSIFLARKPRRTSL
jgi:MFS family permease